VYDYNLKCFYEWGYWNAENNEYDQFRGRCSCYCPDWNMHIIGDRENGKLYKMSEDYTTDKGDSIRTEVITGNYSDNILKQSNQIKKMYFHTRRGDGKTSDSSVAPKAYVQYKTNFTNSWSNQMEIDLGAVGQVVIPPAQINSGLSFNSVQYRILHMDDSKFVLNGIYIE
jgi:hypothetical protein